MKKFLMFLFAISISAGAWAVDEISVETATSVSVGKVDLSAYEKEIYDEHSNRWANYELGIEAGTDVTDKFSVAAGFEYYEARASMDDGSKTYLSLSYALLDYMSLCAEYSYEWSQTDYETESIEYGVEFEFELPLDITLTDSNKITSNIRRNSHVYVNEFDISKTLFSWGDEDENNLSLLLGEEIEYDFETDLLVSATSSVGLETAIGAATASVTYNFTDNYHDPIDSNNLEICLSWDF